MASRKHLSSDLFASLCFLILANRRASVIFRMGTLNELKDLARKNLVAILASIAGIVCLVLLIVIIIAAAAASNSDVRTFFTFLICALIS